MRVAAALTRLLGKKRRHEDLQLYGLSPSLHAFMDRSFSFLTTSGLLGIVVALHRCAKVDLYGFQVHPRHGVQYHYYNPKDQPANEIRDDTEWLAVKALAIAGLVNFAEPCIVECHTSEKWCEDCQATLSGGTLDEPDKSRSHQERVTDLRNATIPDEEGNGYFRMLRR
mmetsp:Transcript_24956/g.47386  ORF Transcript_24956/g.47386 Transcript_24956/m.47386 type:complete len:169 (+) Transcript_24956:286-792(+)